jgi:hypothetical protein
MGLQPPWSVNRVVILDASGHCFDDAGGTDACPC